MEDCLPLVVPQPKAVLGPVSEKLADHLHIVLLQAVKQRKRPVMIRHIQPRPDLVDKFKLLVQAQNVLDCLTLVVLLASSFVEGIVTSEPVKDGFVPVSRAFKERVLSKAILDRQGLELMSLEELKDFKLLDLCSDEERCSTFEVRR